MLYQYLILFFWSLVAATFFPVSSEVFLAGMLQQNKGVVLFVVLVATAGNVIGGIITFYMGLKGGDIALKKMTDKNIKRYHKAEKIVNKYGVYSMALSWVPFIGDVIVLLGGVFKLPLIPSIIWMTVGKFLRYLVFAVSVTGLLDYFFK
jgi:membrane protein YqaA with SNARE-associated domain